MQINNFINCALLSWKNSYAFSSHNQPKIESGNGLGHFDHKLLSCVYICVCVCLCLCVCLPLKGTHTENILIFHGIAILTSETLQSKVFMILGFFYGIVSIFL